MHILARVFQSDSGDAQPVPADVLLDPRSGTVASVTPRPARAAGSGAELDGEGLPILTPSLLDDHLHLSFCVKTASFVDLQKAASLPDCVTALAAAPASGAWAVGVKWTPDVGVNSGFDFRAVLDGVPRPALIITRDFHTALANSAGLRALGLWEHPDTASMACGMRARDCTLMPARAAGRAAARRQDRAAAGHDI